MNLDTKQLVQLAAKVVPFVKKYAVFICILVTLSIFGYLVYNIRILANRDPSEAAVIEKMGQDRPISIDESAVEKIQQLQSTNVEVKALFDQTRDNPFQE